MCSHSPVTITTRSLIQPPLCNQVHTGMCSHSPATKTRPPTQPCLCNQVHTGICHLCLSQKLFCTLTPLMPDNFPLLCLLSTQSLNLPRDMRLQWHKTVQNALILFRLRHNTHQKVQFCKFPCSQDWFWDLWWKTPNRSTINKLCYGNEWKIQKKKRKIKK